MIVAPASLTILCLLALRKYPESTFGYWVVVFLLMTIVGLIVSIKEVFDGNTTIRKLSYELASSAAILFMGLMVV